LIVREIWSVCCRKEILGIHRIVYISCARPFLGSDDAFAIAAYSSDWNALNNVTGLLLFNGEHFLQAIEGPPERVLPLLDRIKADIRHNLVQVAESQAVPARIFPDWSMRFKHVGEQQAGEDFINEVKTATAQIENAHVQALLIGFATLGRRTR
jgi:hypothetical protein